MKNISKLMIALLLVLVGVSSCKKEESKIYYTGGTAPVLQLVNLYSGTPDMLVLQKADEDKPALNIKWTNPEYTFTTGVSSQDVNYVLEMDSSGAGFTNPNAKIYTQAIDLNVVYTVKDLNTMVVNLNLDTSVAKKLDFRVTSTLKEPSAAGYFPFVSAIKSIWVKTYYIPPPPPPTLWITGEACPSNWTNTPPSSQQLTWINAKKFEITMDLPSSKYYKFLTKNGAWQPQWGIPKGTTPDPMGGSLDVNDGTTSDPDAIPSPATAGTYKIEVNLATRTFKLTKL